MVKILSFKTSSVLLKCQLHVSEHKQFGCKSRPLKHWYHHDRIGNPYTSESFVREKSLHREFYDGWVKDKRVYAQGNGYLIIMISVLKGG